MRERERREVVCKGGCEKGKQKNRVSFPCMWGLRSPWPSLNLLEIGEWKKETRWPSFPHPSHLAPNPIEPLGTTASYWHPHQLCATPPWYRAVRPPAHCLCLDYCSHLSTRLWAPGFPHYLQPLLHLEAIVIFQKQTTDLVISIHCLEDKIHSPYPSL